jgi:hypothetical protein
MNQQKLFELIESQRINHNLKIKQLCAMIPISKTSYVVWRKGGVSANLCDVLRIMEKLNIKITENNDV